MAYYYFPESPADREQALFIAWVEARRFETLGLDGYKPSFIMKTISNAINKRFAIQTLAGFTAIALTRLADQGRKASLESAAKVVSCLAYQEKHVHFIDVLGTAPVVKASKPNADPTGIKQAFRQYRSVAHIAAARIVAADHLAITHLWEPIPEAFNCVIKTAMQFQDALQSAIDTSGWDIWDLASDPPRELEPFPALAASRELCDLFERAEAEVFNG